MLSGSWDLRSLHAICSKRTLVSDLELHPFYHSVDLQQERCARTCIVPQKLVLATEEKVSDRVRYPVLHANHSSLPRNSHVEHFLSIMSLNSFSCFWKSSLCIPSSSFWSFCTLISCQVRTLWIFLTWVAPLCRYLKGSAEIRAADLWKQ